MLGPTDKRQIRDFSAAEVALEAIQEVLHHLGAKNLEGFEAETHGLDSFLEPLKDDQFYSDYETINQSDKFNIKEGELETSAASKKILQKELAFFGNQCSLMYRMGMYKLRRAGRMDAVMGKMLKAGETKEEEEIELK